MVFLGDVSGKGIEAPLANSAMQVLFNETAEKVAEPLQILQIINREVPKYLEEQYVAGCCLSLGFGKKECKVASVGINYFHFQRTGQPVSKEILHGPFLGMVDEGDMFEQKTYFFQKRDKFFFNSDGLDEFFNNNTAFFNIASLSAQRQYVEQYITRQVKIKDDVTMLAMQIL